MRRLPPTAWYQTVFLVACLGMVITTPARGQRPEPGPYRIASVRAFLYLNQKDSLSANVIDNPDMGELMNVFLGGGAIGSPSDQVIITVAINGKRGRPTSRRKIHLTVKKPNGSVLLDRSPDIGLLSDDGNWFETFVVYGIGCDALRIRAEILGQKERSVVEKKIPFSCGE
jgi:hypothetical protein